MQRIIIYYPTKEWYSQAYSYYEDLLDKDGLKIRRRDLLESNNFQVRFVNNYHQLRGVRCDYAVALGGYDNCPNAVKDALYGAYQQNQLDIKAKAII